jgi:Alr-MurF fusion protein
MPSVWTDREAGRLALGELAELLGGEPCGEAIAGIEPTAVSVHSAHLRPGAVFFGLVGRRNGGSFAPEALAHGAACAVVDPEAAAALTGSGHPHVVVDDPLTALHRLAAWHRRRLDAHVVAVVGSIGKTTTKDALVALLAGSVRVYGSPGSYNSQVGVPLSVLGCPLDAEVAVIEAAATAPGELRAHAAVLAPTSVVVTTVGDRYRESFGTTGADLVELIEFASLADPESGWIALGQSATLLEASVGKEARVLSPGSAEWPDSTRVEVETSSSWLVDDVELAVGAASLLGVSPASFVYRPTSLELQTWRSPLGVTVSRSVAVDDPMALHRSIGDAIASTSPGGTTHVVLTPAAAALSAEALRSSARLLAGHEATIAYVPDVSARELMAASLPASQVELYASTRELWSLLQGRTEAGDCVAVLAERSQTIEGVSRELLEAMSPSRLYIDLASIAANVDSLRRHLGPAVKLLAVVKAAAYGTSSVELARHLERRGVDAFAVSSADEGVALRRGGVAAPVLVLLQTPDELGKSVRYGLTPCIHSRELVAAVLREPALAGVHLEVDTGMSRTGLPGEDALEALTSLRDAGIEITGLMSHLAAADDPAHDAFTLAQLDAFDELCARARELGVESATEHVLATAGALRFPSRARDMVRIGLGCLGVYPSPACLTAPLDPAVSLVTRLVEERELAPGARVGYGIEFEAEAPMRVGVAQIGYSDGISRSFASNGSVVAGSASCRVVGRISMDSMTVDLSSSDAAVGDDVLVFGAHDGRKQRIEDVAEAMGTIPYEVLARLGTRIQRIFVEH